MALLDDFNRADENPISSVNWLTPSSPSVAFTMAVESGRAKGNDSAAVSDAMWKTLQEANILVEVTCPVIPTSGRYIRLYLRCNQTFTPTQGYMMQWENGGSVLRIFKNVGGSLTQIGSSSAVLAANDVVGFEALDDCLTVYQNGSIVLSISDTAVSAAGYVGMGVGDTTVRLDDFKASPVTYLYPTTVLLDDFNRANESPLSSAGMWTASVDGSAAPNLDTNAVVGPVSGTFYTMRTDAAYNADQEAYMSIPTLPTLGRLCSLFMRLQAANIGTSTFTGYQFQCQESSGSFSCRIYYQSAGSATQLVITTISLTAGDKIGAQVQGSKLRFLKYSSGSWRVFLQATHASISSGGFVGFCVQGNVVRIDDFSGGNLIVPPPFLSQAILF
jgi:hypothetical protein